MRSFLLCTIHIHTICNLTYPLYYYPLYYSVLVLPLEDCDLAEAEVGVEVRV